MNKKYEFQILIQARMGSSRLPGKTLLYFKGNTLLGYQIKRLLDAGIPSSCIAIATSDSKLDNVIESYAHDLKIPVYRGAEDNVLLRYQKAAKQIQKPMIVRLTADNPFVDVGLVMHCIIKHRENDHAKLTSTRIIKNEQIKRFVPKGFSVDVLDRQALLLIDIKNTNSFDREHVIPPFYRMYQTQIIRDYHIPKSNMSIDTIDDYVRAMML